MDKAERFWWAVLHQADWASEMIKDDGKAGIRYANVGNIARHKLNKEFGVNLDDLMDEARDTVSVLYAEEVAKEQAYEDSVKQAYEDIRKGRALLGLPPDESDRED